VRERPVCFKGLTEQRAKKWGKQKDGKKDDLDNSPQPLPPPLWNNEIKRWKNIRRPKRLGKGLLSQRSRKNP
jgi:hypothetical protein